MKKLSSRMLPDDCLDLIEALLLQVHLFSIHQAPQRTEAPCHRRRRVASRSRVTSPDKANSPRRLGTVEGPNLGSV